MFTSYDHPMFHDSILRILSDKSEMFKIGMEFLVIYLIIKYCHSPKSSIIDIPDSVVDKLIDEFVSAPMVPICQGNRLAQREWDPGMIDLCSYDVYNIRNKFKNVCANIIRQYGIGTCGPPSFFGILDLHVHLENKVSGIIGTESTVLYANAYTCVHSIISCFSTHSDIIFYYKHCSESILRGVKLSKSTCYEYTDLDNLTDILRTYADPRFRNFVIAEGLSKNRGQVLNLPLLIKLKSTFKVRLIVDESLSIPLLHKKGICGYHNVSPDVIDIRIGSFSYGFGCSGGFFSGSKELAQYQKLSSSSYVFSASLPGFLTAFNLQALNIEFKYGKIRSKIKKFHDAFISGKFHIISHINSPLIIIAGKNTKDEAVHVHIVYKIVQELQEKIICVGINRNPVATIRLIIKT